MGRTRKIGSAHLQLFTNLISAFVVYTKLETVSLNLSKECNSLSYDAMTAHTAVVFTRYMMLSLESRESMIIDPCASFFYTFQMKCLISHGYRLFKCYFKCSGQCF